MKKEKTRIPFEMIVKEAGLNRAARWMPIAFAGFVFVVAVLFCLSVPGLDEFLFSECVPASPLVVVYCSLLIFAGFELGGSLGDFLFAWDRLRKSFRPE